MHGEPFDGDCGLHGGNVGPWGPADCGEQQADMDSGNDDDNNILDARLSNLEISVMNSGDDSTDSEFPNLKTSDADFEAHMRGEESTDGSSEDDMDSAVSSEDELGFPFMELPCEIRLRIYHWIHLMNPIRLTQLAPWYPMPVVSVYYVKAVTLDSVGKQRSQHDSGIYSEGRNEGLDEAPTRVPLLSPWRPHCCMPTAILQASHQIYYESRRVPFRENEFAFVNWYTSGLWAARSFLKGLEQWQRGSMRYARLELLSRDLVRLAEDWKELCEIWGANLRGLRLKILSGGVGVGGSSSWVVAGPPQRGAPAVQIWDADDKTEKWIEHGLKKLKKLRELEVELSIADWDDMAKLNWCERLEVVVNESKADGELRVRVSCVKRIN